jgi:hypothetical protein
VKYSLYAAFRIIAAHDRRHLWQAERVRAQVETDDAPAQPHTGRPTEIG